MSAVIIFYKVQNHYLLVSVDGKESVFIPSKEMNLLIKKKQITKKLLTQCPKFSRVVEKEVGIIQELDNYVAYLVHSKVPTIIKLLFRKQYPLFVESQGEKIINIFRLNSRNKLLSRLSEESASLEDYIESFCKYTMSNGYSLWLYDYRTKVYTYQFGTFHPSKDYVYYSENSSFNEILDSHCSSIMREPSNSEIFNAKANGIKSMVRIKIPMSKSEDAILSFYSRLEKFVFDNALIALVKQFVAMKIAYSLTENEYVMEKTTKELLKIGIDDLQLFSNELVILIAKKLQYEAVTLLLLTPNKKYLKVISSYNLGFNGKPDKYILYPLSKDSLTVKVFKSDEVSVIYDLNDVDHSNIFNEETENNPKSWIGIPIQIEGKSVGVLRLKNKFRCMEGNEKTVCPPRPIDRHNAYLISQLVNSQITAIFKLEELNNNLEIQSNFSKVFRHELRAPIATIGYASENIQSAIEKYTISEKDKRYLDLKIKDIDTLSNRLGFIVKTYTIDDLISQSAEVIDRVSLLQDIIFPLSNLFGHYYKDQYNVTFDIDHNSMMGTYIKGNTDLCNIIMNSVMDNAAKYIENKNKPVKIYSQKNNDNCDIFIESYSIEIHDEEKEVIFDKDGRGKVAIYKKKDGSGIGLWLCKEIISRLDGNISLERRYDPVIFKLQFPLGASHENINNR